MATVQAEPLFVNISSEQEPTIIESLCVQCEEQGKTTLLFTKIPFFQEVIVVAFECEHCGYKNNELQPAGKLKDQGVHITLKCTTPEDLNRDIIKSEHCVLRIPELDFEIPAARSKGNLNTLEGFITNTIDDLALYQEERRVQDPETAAKIDNFLEQLQKYKSGEVLPFHVEIEDPSGNSFIKNPFAPASDPNMKTKHFNRTIEQIKAMGFNPENAYEEHKQSDGEVHHQVEEGINEQKITAHRADFNKPLVDNNTVKEEALIFPTPCHACGLMGENNMCTISVPYFKELIIMAFNCDKCGAKSREVKVGGETSAKAQKITLKVETQEDLRRELFKSETAVIQIPEIPLELTLGDIGGIYSTVEGLIEQIHDHMKDNNPFVGDSGDSDLKQKLDQFFATLKDLQALKRNWTLILDDPLANCFIQNPHYPNEDEKCDVLVYERTWDQNEELGLNDINTDNYEKQA